MISITIAASLPIIPGEVRGFRRAASVLAISASTRLTQLCAPQQDGNLGDCGLEETLIIEGPMLKVHGKRHRIYEKRCRARAGARNGN
jgi:hypothetical protein